MLSVDEITAIRGTFNESLPDTAEVQCKVLLSDGAGGFSESWITAAIVACRISPSGRLPEERMIAERSTAMGIWTLTLPALTDVYPADRIAVGARIFEVIGALARSTEIGRRVVCVELASSTDYLLRDEFIG